MESLSLKNYKQSVERELSHYLFLKKQAKLAKNTGKLELAETLENHCKLTLECIDYLINSEVEPVSDKWTQHSKYELFYAVHNILDLYTSFTSDAINECEWKDIKQDEETQDYIFIEKTEEEIEKLSKYAEMFNKLEEIKYKTKLEVLEHIREK